MSESEASAPGVDPWREGRVRGVRIASAGIAIAAAAITLFSWTQDEGALPAAFGAVVTVAAVVAFVIARRGGVRPAAWILILTQWGVAAIGTVVLGGARSPAVFGFYVAVALAAFLLGARGALVTGAVSVVAALGIALLEARELLPRALYDLTNAQPIHWAAALSTLLVITVSAYFAMGGIRRILEEASASRARYRLVAENASDFIWSLGVDEVFTYASPAVESILGFTPEEFVGRRWEPSMLGPGSPDVRALVREAVAGGRDGFRYEAEHVCKDGRLVWCEVSNRPIYDEDGELVGVSGVTRDISERKRAEMRHRELESQIRQSEKLKAIGQLAGGIAHDFNNYLTVIMGYAEEIAMDLAPEKSTSIKEIQDAADRSSELTRQLLAFSRQQILEPEVLDLNDSIRSMDRLLRRVLGADVALQTICADELGRIKADPSQIEQIILNLAVNARSAMPDGGELTIETGNVILDEEYADTHPDVEAGRYVMVAITDTGVGIDPEIQQNIFEPFFTTRREGTGLGLSTVHGIVEQSGGTIGVFSEPGEGATFRVYLPRVDESSLDPVSELDLKLSDELDGTETVLVVEDQEMVRRLIARTLERRGYRVLVTASAEEALELVEREAPHFDLLLTDIVLPGMNGVELARVLEAQTGVRILYVSGFTQNGIVHRGVLDPGILLLQKPFTVDGLLRKVREAIG